MEANFFLSEVEAECFSSLRCYCVDSVRRQAVGVEAILCQTISLRVSGESRLP